MLYFFYIGIYICIREFMKLYFYKFVKFNLRKLIFMNFIDFIVCLRKCYIYNMLD